MTEMSLDEATKVLNQTKKQAKEKVQWPDQHKEQIKLAVDNDREFVVLDGRSYTITYRGGQFRLTPKEGRVPMGWFKREWVK